MRATLARFLDRLPLILPIDGSDHGGILNGFAGMMPASPLTATANNQNTCGNIAAKCVKISHAGNGLISPRSGVRVSPSPSQLALFFRAIALFAIFCGWSFCHDSGNVRGPGGAFGAVAEGGGVAKVYRIKNRGGGERWGVDFFDAHGRRVRRIVSDTKRGAEKVLHRVLTELEDRQFTALGRKSMTLGELRTLWFEHRSTKRSIKTDKHRWVWISSFFGDKCRVDRVNTGDVVQFRDWLAKQETRRGKQFSNAAVNRVMQLLRAVFNFACRLPYKERPVSENPVAHVKMLRERARDRVASPKEIEAILAAAGDRLGLAVQIAIETGMREGEIGTLTWEHVNLESRTVRAVWTKTDRDRDVPISPRLAEKLETWPRVKDDPRVVGMRPDNISTAFGELVEELGFKDLRFHDLRRTAGTALRRAGVDLVTIKAILGHATWQAMEVYQKVTVDDMRSALARSAFHGSEKPREKSLDRPVSSIGRSKRNPAPRSRRKPL